MSAIPRFGTTRMPRRWNPVLPLVRAAAEASGVRGRGATPGPPTPGLHAGASHAGASAAGSTRPSLLGLLHVVEVHEHGCDPLPPHPNRLPARLRAEVEGVVVRIVLLSGAVPRDLRRLELRASCPPRPHAPRDPADPRV